MKKKGDRSSWLKTLLLVVTGKIAKRPAKDSEPAPLKRIQDAGKNLVLRSTALGAGFTEEKAVISRLSQSLDALVASDNIEAAKFDHDILGKLTLAGSLCDKVIAGSEPVEFRRNLSSLEMLVRQREHFQ